VVEGGYTTTGVVERVAVIERVAKDDALANQRLISSPGSNKICVFGG
jgi:hypothetical protein